MKYLTCCYWPSGRFELFCGLIETSNKGSQIRYTQDVFALTRVVQVFIGKGHFEFTSTLETCIFFRVYFLNKILFTEFYKNNVDIF